MPKDFQQFLTVKEYRKACQFLLDCHSLMFESQLCDLMILSQKSINRLTHKLAECGLVKVHKQGKSNVISLTRSAAQHLLGLNSPPWLPEPNSTTALWNGAYAADYLNKSRHRFIPAPQYREFVTPLLRAVVEEQTAKAYTDYQLKKAKWKTISTYLEDHIDDIGTVIDLFQDLKSVAPITQIEELAEQIQKEENGFLRRATASNLINIAKKQNELLIRISEMLDDRIGMAKSRSNELKAFLPKHPTINKPSLPDLYFPDGAKTLSYHHISSSQSPTNSTQEGSLEKRQTLFVQLPKEPDVMQWPGVSTSANPHEWTFVVLDRNYTPGWYKRLFLHIALAHGKEKKDYLSRPRVPNDKITFTLIVLAPHYDRAAVLAEKLERVWEENVTYIRERSKESYFAIEEIHGWGVKDFGVENLDTDRLFRNSVQNLMPSWDDDDDPFLITNS